MTRHIYYKSVYLNALRSIMFLQLIFLFVNVSLCAYYKIKLINTKFYFVLIFRNHYIPQKKNENNFLERKWDSGCCQKEFL